MENAVLFNLFLNTKCLDLGLDSEKQNEKKKQQQANQNPQYLSHAFFNWIS